MEQVFITIESNAFKTIMNKLDRIENFIQSSIKEIEAGKNEANKLLTGKQVTQMLHISKQTLWRMRDRGDIPYIKQGNICLYALSEVQDILNNKVIRRRRSLNGNSTNE
ncbi:helix-turn-helix domain-containing protein [Dysgonomonas sp. GY75]|uniref:helix-turn-helix transcriptional regulator n=1 Tax=Dysgonomonas sp. GY75 TaxID=2780419 RepID=UPI00188326FE|nr:helix-turn-helix domain-containing protein [Dysgonomonas sp. GY75]MBF0650813.1 helix-turn-helix domain-containing protein [Dysgonomonas sp. GY75]